MYWNSSAIRSAGAEKCLYPRQARAKRVKRVGQSRGSEREFIESCSATFFPRDPADIPISNITGGSPGVLESCRSIPRELNQFPRQPLIYTGACYHRGPLQGSSSGDRAGSSAVRGDNVKTTKSSGRLKANIRRGCRPRCNNTGSPCAFEQHSISRLPFAMRNASCLDTIADPVARYRAASGNHR